MNNVSFKNPSLVLLNLATTHCFIISLFRTYCRNKVVFSSIDVTYSTQIIVKYFSTTSNWEWVRIFTPVGGWWLLLSGFCRVEWVARHSSSSSDQLCSRMTEERRGGREPVGTEAAPRNQEWSWAPILTSCSLHLKVGCLSAKLSYWLPNFNLH